MDLISTSPDNFGSAFTSTHFNSSDFIGEKIDPEIFANANSDNGEYVGDNDSWAETTGETKDSEGNDFVASVSEYLRDNPGSSYEDALKYMSQYSDEWAEKYIDYLMSQDSINKANEYNANREDTAYQRLVADLKRAGLNPAMMYGNSASPVSMANSGVYSPDGSASTNRVSNMEKIKQLLLNAVLAEWQIQYQKTSNWIKALGTIGKLFLGGLSLS